MRDIDILINKFLSENISEQELASLYEWINESEDNKAYFSYNKRLFLSNNTLDTNIDTDLELGKFIKYINKNKISENKIKPNLPSCRLGFKIASFILIIIFGAFYFF